MHKCGHDDCFTCPYNDCIDNGIYEDDEKITRRGRPKKLEFATEEEKHQYHIQKCREHYQQNKEKYRKRQKEYYEKNKEEIRRKAREKAREKARATA